MNIQFKIAALASLTLLLVVNVVTGIYFKSLDINDFLYHESEIVLTSQINSDSTDQKLDEFQVFDEIEENKVKSKKNCKIIDLYFKIEFLLNEVKNSLLSVNEFYNTLYNSLDLLEIIPPPPRF